MKSLDEEQRINYIRSFSQQRNYSDSKKFTKKKTKRSKEKTSTESGTDTINPSIFIHPNPPENNLIPYSFEDFEYFDYERAAKEQTYVRHSFIIFSRLKRGTNHCK